MKHLRKLQSLSMKWKNSTVNKNHSKFFIVFFPRLWFILYQKGRLEIKPSLIHKKLLSRIDFTFIFFSWSYLSHLNPGIPLSWNGPSSARTELQLPLAAGQRIKALTAKHHAILDVCLYKSTSALEGCGVVSARVCAEALSRHMWSSGTQLDKEEKERVT